MTATRSALVPAGVIFVPTVPLERIPQVLRQFDVAAFPAIGKRTDRNRPEKVGEMRAQQIQVVQTLPQAVRLPAPVSPRDQLPRHGKVDLGWVERRLAFRCGGLERAQSRRRASILRPATPSGNSSAVLERRHHLVVTTHNLEEATYCNRLGLMHGAGWSRRHACRSAPRLPRTRSGHRRGHLPRRDRAGTFEEAPEAPHEDAAYHRGYRQGGEGNPPRPRHASGRAPMPLVMLFTLRLRDLARCRRRPDGRVRRRRPAASRELVERFAASGYFELAGDYRSARAAEDACSAAR